MSTTAYPLVLLMAVMVAIASGVAAICPNGYHAVGKTCYNHLDESVDYATAVTRCKQNSNGYLATLEDGDKRKQFNAYIREKAGEGLNVPCDKALDVVFLIDTSSSMGETGLQQQLQFIRSFVSKFNMGPEDRETQFAVVDSSAYGDYIKIRLNDYDDTAAFSAALSDDWYLGMGTMPYRALKATRTEVLLVENGARANVEQIVILINDGGVEVAREMVKQAQLLIKQGVQVFVLIVGTGKSWTHTYLAKAASKPMKEHVFKFENAEELTRMDVAKTCREKIEMWIGRTDDVAPTDDKGVMTTALTSGLRPKEEKHQFVCETDMVPVKNK